MIGLSRFWVLRFGLTMTLSFCAVQLVNAQEFPSKIFQSDWENIKNLLDYSQISEKYNLHYKSFFEDGQWPQRSWNYFNPTTTKSIENFSSDGCSFFPDGTVVQPNLWRDCCIRHDFAYWVGGSQEFKKQADEDLGKCVEAQVRSVHDNDQLCHTIVGLFQSSIRSGVSVGGLPKLYTPWRWGFGWSNYRGYRNLEAQEKAAIKLALSVYKQILLANSEESLGKFGKPRDLSFVLKALEEFVDSL